MKYVRLTLCLLFAQFSLVLIPVAAQAADARKISIEYRGSLGDALQQIAKKGSINLVIVGTFDEPVRVYLPNVTAEDALKALAKQHHLQLEQQGTVWTIQAAAAEPRAQDAPVPSSPPAPPEAASPPKPPETPQEPLSPREARKKISDVTRDLKRKYRKEGNQFHRGNLVIDEGETAQEAVVYSGNLVVNGATEADAVAFGGNIEVSGHIGGNVVAIGGNVHLASTAVVDGDATAIGGTVTKEEGASVAGNVASVGSGESIKVDVPKIMKRVLPPKIIGRTVVNEDEVRGHIGGFLGFLVFFAASFGLAFLAILLFPERIKRIQSELRTDPLRCGLTGIVGSMAVGAICVLLLVTIIGIPLAFVLGAIYFVALVIGVAPVANEIGNRLPWFKGGRRTEAVVLALGTLVLSLVWVVPIMGKLVIGLLSMVTLGAIIRTRFGQRPPPGSPQDPILAQPA